MSKSIGTIRNLPAIDATEVECDAAGCVYINVYVSTAGVELLASPCTLSVKEARELINLLEFGISQIESKERVLP